jgi:hypothetical protein
MREVYRATDTTLGRSRIRRRAGDDSELFQSGYAILCWAAVSYKQK